MKGLRKTKTPWKCERCGKCCNYITVQGTLSKDQIKWANIHEDARGFDNCIIMRSKCVYLDTSGPLATCLLHGTDKKPEMCKAAGEKECVRLNKRYQ